MSVVNKMISGFLTYEYYQINSLKTIIPESFLLFFVEGGTGNFVVESFFSTSGFPSFDVLEPILEIKKILLQYFLH